VLFVSHNLAAVRNLCTRALVFEKGNVAFDGDVGEGIAAYERSFGSEVGIASDAQFNGSLSRLLRFNRLECLQHGKPVDVIDPAEPFSIELSGSSATSFPVLELNIKVFRDGFHVFTCHDTPCERMMREGPFRSRFEFPANVFRSGRYSVGIGAYFGSIDWVWGGDVALLEFAESWAGGSAERSGGAVAVPFSSERIQELANMESGAGPR
jgi:lipopolysaccharide transport system ATP-binding protein